MAFRIIVTLHNIWSGNFSSDGQHTVKLENLRQAHLKPGATEKVVFVTGAAGNEAAALAIATRFSNIEAAHTTFTDAAANSDSGANLSSDKNALFNQLAGGLVYVHPDFRDGAAFSRKNLSKGALWSCGISGDLPILLVRIDAADGKSLVDEAIGAHTYISGRGLRFDLVLLDERDASEADQLKRDHDVEVLGKPGGVHILEGATISVGARDSVAAAARVVLRCSEGSLADQLRGRSVTALPDAMYSAPGSKDREEKFSAPAGAGLLFWNGFGGFSPDGREYVIATDGTKQTPTPWCNIIANRDFGCLTSESGLGYTWADNSQLNRLTPWSNDPVSDPPGEVLYVRDEETGVLWTPTPQPLGNASAVTVRHGQGYSRYISDYGSLHCEMTVHVPISDPIKVIRLSLRNDGKQARRHRQLNGTWNLMCDDGA